MLEMTKLFQKSAKNGRTQAFQRLVWIHFKGASVGEFIMTAWIDIDVVFHNIVACWLRDRDLATVLYYYMWRSLLATVVLSHYCLFINICYKVSTTHW